MSALRLEESQKSVQVVQENVRRQPPLLLLEARATALMRLVQSRKCTVFIDLVDVVLLLIYTSYRTVACRREIERKSEAFISFSVTDENTHPLNAYSGLRLSRGALVLAQVVVSSRIPTRT